MLTAIAAPAAAAAAATTRTSSATTHNARSGCAAVVETSTPRLWSCKDCLVQHNGKAPQQRCNVAVAKLMTVGCHQFLLSLAATTIPPQLLRQTVRMLTSTLPRAMQTVRQHATCRSFREQGAAVRTLYQMLRRGQSTMDNTCHSSVITSGPARQGPEAVAVAI